MLAGSDRPLEDRPNCPTPTKRAHTSRAEAVAHRNELRKRLGQKGVRVYPCDCGYLHVGHLPRAVRSGQRTAAEHYGRDTHPLSA